jgi:putative iron-only hydrogenase system regulator
MIEHRIGVVGIVLERPEKIDLVNSILKEHASIISGRLGIPHLNGRNVNVISLVVDGTNDEIGSLAGKLGKIEGLSVKTAISKKSFEPLIERGNPNGKSNP